MGCDIYSVAEVLDTSTGEWKDAGDVFPLDDWGREWHKKDLGSEPFPHRIYGLFGFLADVRNYACCTPLSEPRGFPDDWMSTPKEEMHEDRHSKSWFLLSELLAFDYDQTFWNRRIFKDGSGVALAKEGEGTIQTYRDLLGVDYFKHLEILKTLGPPENVRVVFSFDS